MDWIINNIHDDINFVMHLCILQEMNNINWKMILHYYYTCNDIHMELWKRILHLNAVTLYT